MKAVTAKRFFTTTVLLATLSGTGWADNTNTTIQEGQINTNDTDQRGRVNDNATYQEGRDNANRTRQWGVDNWNQTGQFGRSNDNETHQYQQTGRPGHKRRPNPEPRLATVSTGFCGRCFLRIVKDRTDR